MRKIFLDSPSIQRMSITFLFGRCYLFHAQEQGGFQHEDLLRTIDLEQEVSACRLTEITWMDLMLLINYMQPECFTKSGPCTQKFKGFDWRHFQLHILHATTILLRPCPKPAFVCPCCRAPMVIVRFRRNLRCPG
jgi:hypothetical protein